MPIRDLRHHLTIAVIPSLLLLIATAYTSALACDVIALKSGDHKPFQDVLRGFRQASACDVIEMKLPSDGDLGTLIQKRPTAIVAIGTAAYRAARKTGLPTVYAMVMPSELQDQSPTSTGVSMDISPETCLATIKNTFPQARRIGLVYDPRNTGAFVDEAARAARTIGLELIKRPFNSPSDAPQQISAALRNSDVFWMLPDASVITSEIVEYLLRGSMQSGIPIFTFSRKYLDQGAVAALDIDAYDIGMQTAELVNRISTGAAPSRVYARKARLSLNRTAAAKLGVVVRDIPSSEVNRHE